jgi:uncharacterized membrane protein YfcA
MEIIILSVASLLAGLMDSIVGGGGLILVPALFSCFPSSHPATLFGTNKSASVWGTAIATVQYSRRVDMRWKVLIPAAIFALTGGFFGAWVVTKLNPDSLRILLPVVLTAVFIYTLAKKDLGNHHAPHHSVRREIAIACLIAAVLGWYDGFFGPGTGSFFIFLFVRFLGYDFLNASAAAKFMNVSTNLAALTLFTIKGHVWWQIGLIMAGANMTGSLIGTRLALNYGSSFVRWVFVFVVGCLILKTGYDALILLNDL